MGVCLSEDVYSKQSENSNKWFPEKSPQVNGKLPNRREVPSSFSHFRINQSGVALISQTSLPWLFDFQEENKNSTLILRSVHGCSSINARLPPRTRITQHPEGFSHTIDNMFGSKVCVLSFGITVCFSMFELFLCYASVHIPVHPQAAINAPQGILCLLCWRHGCFSDKQSQWKLLFPGPNHWTTASVFYHCLYREHLQHINVFRKRHVVQTTSSVNLSNRMTEEWIDF